MTAMTMRKSLSWAVGVFALAASLEGRQSPTPSPKNPRPVSSSAQVEPLPQQIYKIDLSPTGSTFAVNEPKLDGYDYVYRSWPERAIVRVPKSSVKNITQVTKDLSRETAYQLDLLPSGKMIAREEPKLKTGAYVFHAFKNGTLMSVKQSNVKKVTLLTGMPAVKARQEELGATLLVGNLPMQGGTAHAYPAQGGADPPPGHAPGQAPAQGNWHYDGVPGATDAYAPGNATIAQPGDVPKAAPPPPPPPSPQ